MDKQAGFLERMAFQLGTMSKEIEDLSKRLNTMKQENKEELRKYIEQLKQKKNEAMKKFEQLKASGENAKDGLKVDLEKVWVDLKKAVDHAIAEFK